MTVERAEPDPSSSCYVPPFGPCAHYGAAKAALDYYSRTLATELAPSGMRVNVVSPGPISTCSASDRGNWLTGVNYRVDGGMTAR